MRSAVGQLPIGELSDEHLAAIVECSIDAIVSLTLDATIQSWNPAAERLYLYMAYEIVGHHPLALIVPAERLAELDSLIARAVSGELIQGFETVCTRKDGSTVEVSISKSSIRRPAGDVTGVASITRDISGSRLAERERTRFAVERAARVEAEAAIWRASMLAGVSHVLAENFSELQTMLERVARMAALAMDTACTIELVDEGVSATLRPCAIVHVEPAVHTELTRILARPHHFGDSPLHNLGRSFRRGTRCDSLSVPILPRMAAIGVLCFAQFGTDARLFSQRDREFTEDLAVRMGLAVENVPDQVWAIVDEARIEQVMANLIDNAVRYSPDGGPIEVRLEPAPNDWVVITVRDHGPGNAESERAHIFDRFHQARGVDYRSGMGIGLHISREIAALHAGELTCAFPEDGGSEFTVRLPALAPPASVWGVAPGG